MVDYERLLQNYENVLEPKECKKTGEVPSFLKGTMLRNGPGLFSIGETTYNHYFDGMAYIQRFHFQDGKMYYSARFLESDEYKENIKAQRIIHSQFGTYKYPDPCKSIFARFFSYYFEEMITDNDAVAFSKIGDGIYALTETPFISRMDPDSLERLEKVDVSKYLTLNTATAHHHSDEEGNIYNIGTLFGKDSEYIFATTVNPLNHQSQSSHSLEHTKLIGKLPCSEGMSPGYVHSFGMTENFMILFESPSRINVKKLIFRLAFEKFNSQIECFRKLMSYTIKDAFSWKGSKGVNVLILDRKTGKKRDIKITSDPFFAFHHANSFEKDGFIVLDYCKMENPGDFSAFSVANVKNGILSHMPPELVPYLHRMIAPLSVPSDAKSGTDLLEGKSFAKGCTAIVQDDGSVRVTDRRICEVCLELPRYHYEKYNMKDYKFVYGTCASSDTPVGVVKANVQDGHHMYWEREDSSHLCAEPVFVPDPEGTEEDDGILLVPVMTSKDDDPPFVLILNAKNMKEMARFLIPEKRIPLGFHALFASR